MSARKAPPSESAATTPLETIPVSPGGVCVLSGYGLKVKVERDFLSLNDGLCERRRAVELDRASCGLKHLLIIGRTGSISLDALGWLHGVGASVSVVRQDGEVILTSSPPGADLPHLRAAQVVARFTETGVKVSAYLLSAKVRGQAEVLSALGRDDAARELVAVADTIEGADDFDTIRLLEARSAARYWECWESLPVLFARKDLASIAGHWTVFGQRESLITGTPRDASNPANALLNLLYSVALTETSIALRAQGLDPGLGWNHRDKAGRDSASYDVVEVVRAAVDRWLLELLRSRTFAKADFFEMNNGVVRLTSKLAVELCQTAPLWRKAVAPAVECVARILMDGYKPEMRLATNLTHSNRLASRAWMRKRSEASIQVVNEHHGNGTIFPKASGMLDKDGLSDLDPGETMSAAPKQNVDGARIPKTCPECGKPVTERKRRFCSDACANAQRRDFNQPKAAAAAQTPEALAKRSVTNATKKAEMIAWEREHPDVDLESERKRFDTAILPGLVALPTAQITATLGCSTTFVRAIRQGKARPHPMHYAKLVALLDSLGNQS